MESYSPWPAEGRIVRFEFRRAFWAEVLPMYDADNIKHVIEEIRRCWFLRFWYPFFSYRISLGFIQLHGYMGWKPINVAADPAFYWRHMDEPQAAIARGDLFVQLSFRGGTGSTS